MSSLDLSNLSGSDAVAALRSYPRRFRAAVAAIRDDPNAEELAHRIGSGGHSAVDVVLNTKNTWILQGRALHDALVNDEPVLHAGVVHASQREWAALPDDTVGDALAQLDEEAAAVADAVERIHGPDLTRTANVAGGGTVTVLDLIREAVRTGAEGLRDVETTLASIR
jgi:hypothetical protein